MHLISSLVGVPRTCKSCQIKHEVRPKKPTEKTANKEKLLSSLKKKLKLVIPWLSQQADQLRFHQEIVAEKVPEHFLESFLLTSNNSYIAVMGGIIPTCPSNNSARTQPADQMSMAVVYSVAPKMSSGAR